MKKKKYFIRAVLVMLLSFSIYVINYNSINKKISRDLGVHIPSSLKIEYEDSHGGFHGDGMTSGEANLNQKQIDEIVSKSEEEWSQISIPSEIRGLVSNRYKEGNYNNLQIYNIENAYWIFKDRTLEGTKERFPDATSGNYSLGVIDLDNNILYYIKFDS